MKCAKGAKSATNRNKSGKKEKYEKKQNSILEIGKRKSNVFLFKKTPKRWKMEAKIYEI